MRFALAGSSSNHQSIGVRKNHGSSAAVRMCSTSRKSTFAQATSSARPATSPTKSSSERDRQPDRRARSGTKTSDEDDQDRDHHGERHRLRRDHRERDELAREPHLLDQLGAVDHRARGRLQRDARRRASRRAPPAGRSGSAGSWCSVQSSAEDDQVDTKQDERVQERPGDAEDRALVLRLEVPPEEVGEELAVAQEIGVDRHRASVRAACDKRPSRQTEHDDGAPSAEIELEPEKHDEGRIESRLNPASLGRPDYGHARRRPSHRKRGNNRSHQR